MGYSLTGSTKERAMAVLHGVGKNGKSTLVELFQDLLGDYSGVANPNTTSAAALRGRDGAVPAR
jgi:putative DNA primase/helicase